MSTTNLALISITIILLSAISCSSIKKEEDEMRCFEELPVTEAFIEILNNPFYAEQLAVESEFHKMVFSMSSSGTICSIGYRSGPIETGAIEIQIINESGIIVYSEKYNYSS